MPGTTKRPSPESLAEFLSTPRLAEEVAEHFGAKLDTAYVWLNTSGAIAVGRQKGEGRHPGRPKRLWQITSESQAKAPLKRAEKLDELKVRAIRCLGNSNQFTQDELGLLFGVTGHHVSSIMNGLVWKTETPPEKA